MTTTLDAIIDAASDPAVRLADLLRRTIVLAHRLQAPVLREWAHRELSGYGSAERDDLPLYRRTTSVAEVVWSGPMGSSEKRLVSPLDAPPEFSALFEVRVLQAVSELETLVQSENDLGFPWPALALVRWNDLAEEGAALRFQFMHVYNAKTIVQRTIIDGVLDAVRTRLLTLALDLQTAAGNAGESGGVTAKDPRVGSVVNQFITNIYGEGATVAQGAQVHQTVTYGDVRTLTEAAAQVGLSKEGLAEFVAAVLEARSEPKRTNLQRFLGAVRSGGVSLAGGITSNIAADQLTQIASAFLGG